MSTQHFLELEEHTGSGGHFECGLLIEAIQQYPYLYDKSNKLYKDAKKKAEAWSLIGELLNCTKEECMKWWKNLRDRYVKEKNKCASGSEAPETNWRYYDAMRFYEKYTKPRNTHTSTPRTPTIQSSDDSSFSPRASLWGTLGSPTTLHSVEDTEETAEIEAVPGPSKRKRSVTPETSSYYGKKRAVEEQMGDIVNVAKGIMEKFEQKKQQKNANSTFAEYIYAELENMSEEEAKEKRKQILRVLFDV
nr:unnamed protein product [Callosobruchus chinensis]CAH7768942.1 unnamed protein product [Callosobruchus chinensis]